MENRAGKTVRNFSGDTAYDSFYPRPLPPEPELVLVTPAFEYFTVLVYVANVSTRVLIDSP